MTGSRDRNQEIIDLFADLVRLATLDEGGPASFRVRAYENAQRELEEYRGDLAALSEKELTAIEGIGKSTAKKIREYFDTGRIAKLDELRAKYPPELVELTRIPGLGPKSVLTLRDKLGIHNIDQLREALEQERIRELDGFGEKKEQNLAKALERMGGLGKNKRRSLSEALPLAELLVGRLFALPQVSEATYCGSLRRFRETIGDIDIVAVAGDHQAVMDAFVAMQEVEEIVGQGDTKSSVIVRGGLQVDLRVVDAEQVGAAILYFTGSKAHNIKLRQRAIARGWTLNEYGLSEVEGGAIVASKTERDIYRALELEFIPPAMREDHGEVEAAAARTLPALVSADDVVVDFGVSLEGVSEARKSDLHTLFVQVPASELAAARKKVRGKKGPAIRWVASFELGETVRAVDGADAIALAVPPGLEGDLTERLMKAIAAPEVRMLIGASGRRLGQGPIASLDVEAVAAALADKGALWVVRSDLHHLDPSADDLRRIRDSGVSIALASGSQVAPLACRAYGPQHCQRGWVGRDSLASAWDPESLAGWLSAA